MKKFLFALIVAIPSFLEAKEQSFSELVGPVVESEVKDSATIDLPYITWGGDAATFLANGLSVETSEGSYFNQRNLKFKLVNGDDFIQQCRNYLSGKTPFLRCTFGQLGLASEVLGKNLKTKPTVVLQLTYSLGDHVIARGDIKNLNDLKPKNGKKVKVCLQKGGPHVTLVDDTLKIAQLTWNDIDVVWTDDLTAPFGSGKGPAELFRKDQTIDICCVITPDMLVLTGGLESTGKAEGVGEGAVVGAKVINSTFNMNRSIADIYVVRTDWYNKNKEKVDGFIASYLLACEKIVKLRNEFNTNSQRMTPEYKNILQFTKNTLGTPEWSLEVDTHGLLLDASFVGISGNESFFKDSGNIEGFEGKQKSALDLAVSQGYAASRFGFNSVNLDYAKIAEIAKIEYKPLSLVKKEKATAEDTTVFPDDTNLDDKTLISFTVGFENNQAEFSVDQYGTEFLRVLEQTSKFGNAVVVIRGHSDPTKTLLDFIKAGVAKGVINKTGTTGNYKYFIHTTEGVKPLDLNQTKLIARLIQDGTFDNSDPNPRETMQAALNLSISRAEAVKAAIVKFAQDRKVNLDSNQIKPVGVGIAEPIIPKPTNAEEARANRRVEFRLVRVPAESVKQSDYDF
jgi:hypothetical protein